MFTIFYQNDLPDKLIIELLQDDFWTNFLLIANIVVSVLLATFIKMRYDKKAKELEKKSYIDKIKAEQKLNFCLTTFKIFKKICAKNPRNISNEDILEINELVISKELMLISDKSERNIKKFRDYILEIKADPLKKEIRDEKSFFFLIESIITDL